MSGTVPESPTASDMAILTHIVTGATLQFKTCAGWRDNVNTYNDHLRTLMRVNDDGLEYRIKPKTKTVQAQHMIRKSSWTPGKEELSYWASGDTAATTLSREVIEKSPTFVRWVGDITTVELEIPNES